MLNISQNPIDRDEILKDQSAYQEVSNSYTSRKLVYLFSTLFLIGFAALFLPWTQNIRARGLLTTMNPEDREQSIHSVISGRIEKWYVLEGQLVKKGDTIVHISEMKSEYLDPEILGKSRNQTEAKKSSVSAYKEKAEALNQQIVALEKNQKLKLSQARNYLEQAALKVTSDSIDYATAQISLEIARKQFDRQQKLYGQGLKSLTELEQRRQKLQESLNKELSAKNKWLASQNGYINAQINLGAVANDYAEKIAKAKSERMSALSSSLEAEGDFNKLSIQQENYARRSGFYFITAPQDGFVTRALITGIGETVKEGEEVFTFIPANYELAVELYIRPIDLPLVHVGNKVRMQFDGWPALVFNGWPGMSFGTFGGMVASFDKAAQSDGTFRILVIPDPEETAWPELLRLGSGVYGIALLNNVPVWYELWRNLNGFPPDFYTSNESVKVTKK